MSLVLCPECGIKISDKAISCPYCGFRSDDSIRPISEQDSYEIIPTFEYDIEEWLPNKENLNIISYDDNKNLINFFGNWTNIQRTMPSLAETINAMALKETILVADMDSYIKDLIEKGIYRFTKDKTGQILPTIRDSKGIVKQVRLKKIYQNPQLAQSLNNLHTQMAMAQILDEIKCIGIAISDIHIELQNDRLAMVDSAKDKLLQAFRIQDHRLKEIAVLNIINSATDAKHVLMRNFSQNLQGIKNNADKSRFQSVFSQNHRSIDKKAIDSFQALIAIFNVIQVECKGYSVIGEYEASKECLLQFKDFILENHLDKRDTLLLINESTKTKQIQIVDEFSIVANKISNFQKTEKLESYLLDELEGGNQSDETKK